MNGNPIIDPKTMPTWVAVGFALAILALVLGFTSLYRTKKIAAVTQAEVLVLNQRIEALNKRVPAAAPAAPVAQASIEKK